MSREKILILGLVISVALFFIFSRRNESVGNKENDNPLAEAEVYLAYGEHKKAIKILEKYLLSNPDNAEAMELLNKAKG